MRTALHARQSDQSRPKTKDTQEDIFSVELPKTSSATRLHFMSIMESIVDRAEQLNIKVVF